MFASHNKRGGVQPVYATWHFVIACEPRRYLPTYLPTRSHTNWGTENNQLWYTGKQEEGRRKKLRQGKARQPPPPRPSPSLSGKGPPPSPSLDRHFPFLPSPFLSVGRQAGKASSRDWSGPTPKHNTEQRQAAQQRPTPHAAFSLSLSLCLPLHCLSLFCTTGRAGWLAAWPTT